MQLIKDNPYRTVGLLVGASAKEQARQIQRLKLFIGADQEPQEDFSFPTLGKLHRTIDSVDEAASKLNLDRDKINAALFWFYDGSHTDEPAFDALKRGDINEATKIWGTKTSERDVVEYNLSAFHNISTLMLNVAFDGVSISETLLEKGIRYKLKFLDSDFIKNFQALATDETFKITKKELQLLFLNQVHSELDKHGGITTNNFLEILNKQSFSAKDDFLKGYVQKPIEQMEKKIADAKTKRKANKADAANAGNALYDQTSESLVLLKSILGLSDIRFSSISDKVSDEILQCGIDYYSHYKSGNTDGSISIGLFRKAKELATGNIAKQRCNENIDNLNESIKNQPILNDLEKLKNLIDEYERKTETVANANILLSSAKPHLNNMKLSLGSSDELYTGFSSRIASDAQGMCISEINSLQEKISNAYDRATKLALFGLLKTRVNEAWNITTAIAAMDLRQEFRTRYVNNRNALSGLRDQLASVNTGSRGNPGGGSCYIATMAYGDYDHPQVMILREFRDNVMSKSSFGRWVIEKYYQYSPKLVERLKGRKYVNSFVRKLLDQIVRLIK